MMRQNRTISHFLIFSLLPVIVGSLISCGKNQSPTQNIEATIAAGIAATQTAAPTHIVASKAPTLTSIPPTQTSTPIAAPTATTVATPLPSPTNTPSQVQPGTLSQFESGLMQHITLRDWDGMKSMMSDPFTIAGWLSEGLTWTPDEAIQKLHTIYLASNAPMTCDKPQAEQLQQLLGGTDAYTMWGAYIQVASIYFCQGWGADGQDQALVVIAQQGESKFYWYGILVAKRGFQPSVSTNIQATVFATYVNLRAGPSTVHKVLGDYPEGITVTVSAKAPGDEWVQVTTPDNSTGWMAVNFLSDVDITSLPVIQPADSLTISGKVLDSLGTPVANVVVAVAQDTSKGQLRTDAVTGSDGVFYAYLPANSQEDWYVRIVGVDCAKPIVDINCKFTGSFEPSSIPIKVPQTQTLTFVYQKEK